MSLSELELNRNVEATLVEVGSRLVVVHFLVQLRHPQVGLKALLDLVVSLELLAVNQALLQLKQSVPVQIQTLAPTLVELEFLLVLLLGFDVGGSLGFGMRQVEEVDVGLHKTRFEECDPLGLLIDFFAEVEAALVVVGHVLAGLVGGSDLAGVFLGAVLLESFLFGLLDEFVFFLGLALLDDVADARVRVKYGFQFHI